MTVAKLPPIGYAVRPDRVRESCAEMGVDGLLVTDLVSVRWLTGFTGSSATVVLTPDELIVVTDGRYRDRAADEFDAAGVQANIRIGFTKEEQHAQVIEACRGLDAIGAEGSTLAHERWSAFAKDLPIQAADSIISDARRSKDAGEIARIVAACRSADAALAEVAPELGSGLTEADVRMELEYRMRRHGADGPSYDTIVASGPNHSARPHHEASGRRIVDGDTVIIDVGGMVDGYHSDMTRSYVIGEPTDEHREIYEFLLGVQLAGLDAVMPGVAARDVDAACRELIDAGGYADWFLHSTGHGVGLRIHEDPFEAPTSTSELRAGDVVTVEPGLYRVGFGGFRIEDLVEVTDTGCRVLTESPKDTPCLPSPPTT